MYSKFMMHGQKNIKRTDMSVTRFPDDENRDGPRNAGLLAVQALTLLLARERCMEFTLPNTAG